MTGKSRPEPAEEGWWPDPAGSGDLRWWDGTSWTERVRKTPPEPVTGANKPAPAGERRAWPIYAALGVVVALLITSLVGGAYLVGQSTRKSDKQVAAEQRAAVALAVRETRSADLARRKRILDRMRRRNRVVVRRVVRKMKRAAERRAAQSYASGQSSGYSSGNAAGYEAGTQDGLVQGSDQLTCSDDPDVTWLPFC